MKLKLAFLSLTSIGLLALWGCGIQKNNPEEIIKQTQTNVINKITNTVLAKKEWEFKSNINLFLNSPMWSWDLKLTLTWLANNLTWEIYLSWLINYNIPTYQEKWKIQLSTKLITTVKKLYFKILNLEVQTTNPQLQAYSEMIKMLINKWFYLDLSKYSTNQKYNLQKVDFKKILSKYPIFKPEKTLDKNKFKVELDKDNIANIIIKANEQLKQQISKDEIKKSLSWFNIEWVLTIKEDKLHFEFSWYIENYNQKIPVQIKYLTNKLYIDLPTIEINLNLNKDKYDWYVNLKQQQIKLNVNWLLNNKVFEINLQYNVEPINLNLYVDYQLNTKKIQKINIPENAINLEKIINNFKK